MSDSVSEIVDDTSVNGQVFGTSSTLNHFLKILPLCRFALDSLLLVVVFFLLVVEKIGFFPDNYRIVIILALLIFWLVSISINSHRLIQHQSFKKAVFQIFFCWFSLVLCMLFFGFVTKTTSVFSREVFLQWIVLMPLIQLLIWLCLRSIASVISKTASQHNQSIVIGTGTHAANIALALVENTQTEHFLGYVQDVTELKENSAIEKAELLGESKKLRELIRSHPVRKIYIALNAASSDRVQELEFELLDLNVDVIWVPDMRAYHLVNHSIYTLAGNPAIAINQSPLTSSSLATLYKSLMDKTLSLLAILFLLPLFFVVSILVKFSSKGPIIFKQDRHGFDGAIIRAWKFRTMYLHEVQEGRVVQAKKNDSRITPIGRILRTTSIDELPQLFNVLFGQMSLVGPRPHALSHNHIYAQKIDSYLVRHRMKPGITGLAQINGFRGETDSLDKMKGRVELDLVYINNWSLWLDIKILLKTPACLFRIEAY